MIRVVWDDRALDQLDAIEAFISNDSPRSAKLVKTYVVNAARLLETSPRLGKAVPNTELRELVLSRYPYILSYTAHRDEVRILAVFHQQQNRR